MRVGHLEDPAGITKPVVDPMGSTNGRIDYNQGPGMIFGSIIPKQRLKTEVAFH